MNTQVVYFSLKSAIYAAQFEDSIIILQSETDSYLSLIDDAAKFLKFILQEQFTQDKTGAYSVLLENCDNETINYWINYFCEQQFIEQNNKPNQKPITKPLKGGGLCDYRWDFKPSWQPFTQTSKLKILQALFYLARVHRTMKCSGIHGLLRLLIKNHKNSNLRKPTEQEIAQLSAAVDAASRIYPKKTFCLAWATTYVLVAHKHGLQAQLVIGVQTNPFYAHAWAEDGDKNVIHDDPAIAQVLSIILKTSL